MFENQLRHVERRWPRVGTLLRSAPHPRDVRILDEGDRTLVYEGVQVSSARNRHDEALLQASLVPGNASRATVYGLALGDLPRVLLGREALASLTVVLFNPSLVRAVLEHVDLSDWLDDPRVDLAWAGDRLEPDFPFAAAPGSLRLASEEAAALRDRVQLELATPFLRRHARRKEESLAGQIAANRALLDTDPDVADLFGAWPGSTLHVAAAGPTLRDSLARLASRPAGEPLVAVDAALRSLLDAGAVPDVVLAIDPSRKGILPYFRGDLSPCAATTLVYAPAVHPDVLARWPGPRRVAYTSEACYGELAAREPRGTLFVSGTVTHCAVDLAVRGGAAEVVLHGADFSFPRGLSHVEGAAHVRRMDVWLERGVWVVNGHGERVATLPNLRGYLRDLETYLRRHPAVRFRSASAEGARIEGAPPEQRALEVGDGH